MIDWLCWLRILPIELFFRLNGEGAFVCPMAFILSMEIAERDFLSSTPIVSSVFLVPLFAMVTIITDGPFFVAVPLSLPPVMVL